MTYKPVTAADMLAREPQHIRDAVKARADQLIEEYTLRQVREAVDLTQAEVALAAGATQDQISKVERRADLMVSTLEKHIQALGGRLRLAVEFPDRPSVAINLKGGRPVAPSRQIADEIAQRSPGLRCHLVSIEYPRRR